MYSLDKQPFFLILWLTVCSNNLEVSRFCEEKLGWDVLHRMRTKSSRSMIDNAVRDTEVLPEQPKAQTVRALIGHLRSS